jgi:LCP family protein required for cell wall assembly
VAQFFKRNWQIILTAIITVIIISIAILLIRVFSFANSVSGERKSDATPTADVQAVVQLTATAEAKRCAVSLDCLTPTPGVANTALAITPTPVMQATATPRVDVSGSKVVSRIKNNERVTMLYMGYSDPGRDAAYLTDTVLVLSYDPQTQTVTQFNVPRDLYVSVPLLAGGKTTKAKMNGVFSTIMGWEKPTQDELDSKYRWTNKAQQHEAAANLVANTVQNVLGFKVDYWMTMNFYAFKSLIDRMGGVTVCVDRAFVDNTYPRNDDDKVDAGVITVRFEKGCQLMDGNKAIQFARSRNSKSEEGGDFARSARQMKVISAIKDEILKKNLVGNALGYMDALQDTLRVSLPLDEMASVAAFFNSDDGKKIIKDIKFAPEIMTGNNFLRDVDKGGTIGYALVPREGEDKYTNIQAWVQNSFKHSNLRRENVRIQVLNATGIKDREEPLTEFFTEEGFRQADSEPVPVEDATFLIDYTGGAATAHLERLKGYLPDLKVTTSSVAKKPYENAPDLMLYIGKDYKGITTGRAAGQPTQTPKP